MNGCKSSTRSRWQRGVWAVTALAGLVLRAGGKTPVMARPLKAGDRLPAFKLKTIDGRPFDAATIKHRPLWITFFMST